MSQPTINQTSPDVDQAEFDTDMACMRDLRDKIDDRVACLNSTIGVHQVQMHRLRSAVEIDALEDAPGSAAWLDPWPVDDAAQPLAAWRGGRPLPQKIPAAAPIANDQRRSRWWRRTVHKRTISRFFGAASVCVVVTCGSLYGIAQAKAAPGVGCETIRWGFLGSQLRTVCDTPRRSDGSWTRAREVWVSAGWVPGWCSRYSCTAGYYRERGTVAYEEYPVTDATVLPDEPGWLPTGSVVIR